MMQKQTYKVLLHSKVPKELKSLPQDILNNAKETIDALALNPIPPAAAKLQGRMGCYRIRIGNYRIVYEVHVTEVVVYIVGIAHRKEVYRQILRRVR
jgi:mRNA interferase RelE/StbE